MFLSSHSTIPFLAKYLPISSFLQKKTHSNDLQVSFITFITWGFPQRKNKNKMSHIILKISKQFQAVGGGGWKFVLFILCDSLIAKPEILKENLTKRLTEILFEMANIHKMEMSISKEMDASQRIHRRTYFAAVKMKRLERSVLTLTDCSNTKWVKRASREP